MIGSLTLDQLRVLVTIADVGSFSAAGRKLRRAQSAISQAVATLEDVQGVTLFDRAGHRPRLTEAGRALVGQARVVLAGATRFEAMAATREGVEPELAVTMDSLVPAGAFVEGRRGGLTGSSWRPSHRKSGRWWCPRPDSNRHGPGPGDFKSPVSTVPPRGRRGRP